MTNIRTLTLAGLALIGSAGAAFAYQAAPVPANQFYALYQPQVSRVMMPAYYDHSGSIGRLNFGASPNHPEGPGNFSD